MIIIGEKINGAIPAVKTALLQRDDSFFINLALSQVQNGANYLECAPSGDPAQELEDMKYLVSLLQKVTEVPLCLDSPNEDVLAQMLTSGLLQRCGFINSVSMERNKCDVIFPLIAGTEWKVIGLTCDGSGIPSSAEKRLDLARQIMEKAREYSLCENQLWIDPGVLSLAVEPDAMNEFIECMNLIRAQSPATPVIGALSNISYNMPARKYINEGFLCYLMENGIDGLILNPCNDNLRSMIYACSALLGQDKGGRKYNRAYRNGLVGTNKV